MPATRERTDVLVGMRKLGRIPGQTRQQRRGNPSGVQGTSPCRGRLKSRSQSYPTAGAGGADSPSRGRRCSRPGRGRPPHGHSTGWTARRNPGPDTNPRRTRSSHEPDISGPQRHMRRMCPGHHMVRRTETIRPHTIVRARHETIRGKVPTTGYQHPMHQTWDLPPAEGVMVHSGLQLATMFLLGMADGAVVTLLLVMWVDNS